MWTTPEGAPSDLVAKWNRYIQALADHETGHVRNVVENYHFVLEAIKGTTCTTAEAAATAVLTRLRQYDSNYDAATEHGRTQGARFP